MQERCWLGKMITPYSQFTPRKDIPVYEKRIKVVPVTESNKSISYGKGRHLDTYI